MNYSKSIKKAALIAFEAHEKDVDKAGYPYFMHPLTLAVQFDDEDTVIAALLHDVVEDHGDHYSFEYLEKQGFSEKVMDALRLLTHSDGVPYLDYVKAIKGNEIARRVKLADLKHNTDLRRRDGIKPPKYDLYLQAIALLEE